MLHMRKIYLNMSVKIFRVATPNMDISMCIFQIRRGEQNDRVNFIAFDTIDLSIRKTKSETGSIP